MFGDQTSPRECASKFRSLSSESNVAHHGVDETQASTCPIYGSDHGFWDRESVVMSLVSQLPWWFFPAFAGAYSLEHVHVGSRAEPSACASDHYCLHVTRGSGAIQSIEVLGTQLTGP